MPIPKSVLLSLLITELDPTLEELADAVSFHYEAVSESADEKAAALMETVGYLYDEAEDAC